MPQLLLQLGGLMPKVIITGSANARQIPDAPSHLQRPQTELVSLMLRAPSSGAPWGGSRKGLRGAHSRPRR